MRKTLLVLALSALTVLMVGAPALATEEPVEEVEREQVCLELDSGKIDVEEEIDTITVTAPEGYVIVQYCVKAGSVNQGGDNGPVYVDDFEPTTEITFGHPTGRNISHYSVEYNELPPCEDDQSCEPIERTRNEVDEWETEEFVCGDTTVIETRGTYTYTEVSYDNGETWEPVSASGSIEVRERDLTEEEIASLGDCTENPCEEDPDAPECDRSDDKPQERERVTETEWVDGEFECDDTTVTQTRTVTTVTERSTDGGETWEAVASSTSTEERTRDLTADEIEDCPEEVFCPDGLVYNEATGKCELPDSGFGSVALALAGLSSIGGGIALLRRKP